MDALAKLLDLSKEEKLERGLLYTPAEIAQQPATWESTFRIFQQHRSQLAEFLADSAKIQALPVLHEIYDGATGLAGPVNREVDVVPGGGIPLHDDLVPVRVTHDA